jgi:hypothetical protein
MYHAEMPFESTHIHEKSHWRSLVMTEEVHIELFRKKDIFKTRDWQSHKVLIAD